MVVSDYYELLILLRAIMEAKFRPTDYETEVIGSPYLANVANRIIDALVEMEKERAEDNTSKWQK